ncbi:hypothetical protein ACEN88_26360, partial [Massilia sp. CT11-108]
MTTSSYPDTRLLIANEWVDATGGKTIPVVNPATGQAIGTVAHAAIADLDRALAAGGVAPFVGDQEGGIGIAGGGHGCSMSCRMQRTQ